MTQWWDSLDTVLRVLYCISIPATLILLLQTVLSLVAGFGDSGGAINPSDTSGLDLDSDLGELGDAELSDIAYDGKDGSAAADSAILRLFTLQGIVAFLTVFGWSSIVAITNGANQAISLLTGLVLGFIAMLLIAKMVQASRKLVENGTLNVKNAIGETGKVYLTIPAAQQGEGKVMVQVQGQLNEFSAITLDEETLSTGSTVRIIDLRGDTLVVEKEPAGILKS